MVRPGRERLCGDVEIDETFIGGVKRGSRGKLNKIPVAIAAEIRGKYLFSELRLRQDLLLLGRFGDDLLRGF